MNAMAITPSGMLIDVAMIVGRWGFVFDSELDSTSAGCVAVAGSMGVKNLRVVESVGCADVVELTASDFFERIEKVVVVLLVELADDDVVLVELRVNAIGSPANVIAPPASVRSSVSFEL